MGCQGNWCKRSASDIQHLFWQDVMRPSQFLVLSVALCAREVPFSVLLHLLGTAKGPNETFFMGPRQPAATEAS